MTIYLLRDTNEHGAIWLLIQVLIEQRGLRTSAGRIRLSVRSILLIWPANNFIDINSILRWPLQNKIKEMLWQMEFLHFEHGLRTQID